MCTDFLLRFLQIDDRSCATMCFLICSFYHLLYESHQNYYKIANSHASYVNDCQFLTQGTFCMVIRFLHALYHYIAYILLLSDINR
jgi:hypothetical protein